MGARFEDGTPVTYTRLARRAAEALRSMVRNSQADLRVLATLAQLIRQGDLAAAQTELGEIEAYLTERQQLITDVELPALDGLDADIALQERLDAAAKRKGAPVPGRRAKRWH